MARSAFDRLTKALLARDPRHTGHDYICPIHDDRKPSLGVRQGNGKILIKCAAGCDTAEVVAALGMTMSDLFNGAGPSPSASLKVEPLPTEAQIKKWHSLLIGSPTRLRYMTETRGISKTVLRKYQVGWDTTASAYTYPIRDREGRLINVKRKKKGRKPWTLKGRPLFLWPADQLDSPYLGVGEGEEDALVCISHGLPTVSVPNGAGKGKWKAEWNQLFSGKVVALHFDADDAGRALAEEAGDALSAYAQRVRVLDLDPESNDGYDVSDWFNEEGHDRKQFEELLSKAPVVMAHRLVLVSAWDRLERLRREPPPKWRLRPIFMVGQWGVLAAPSKAGKSWDIAAINVSVASGEPLWGLLGVDEPCEVAYFVGEDDEPLTLQRLDAIARFLEVDPQDVLSRIHVAEAVPKFGSEKDLDVVREQLDRHPDIRFVSIEPLYLTAPGADARLLFDMAEMLGAIQQVVVHEARCDLLIGHHWNEAGKGTGAERMSGAGPAEWGRVLLNGSPGAPAAQPDFFIKRTMDYKIEGSRIPHTELHLERFIRQEDVGEPSSPFHYRAEAKMSLGARTVLSPSDQEVLDVLTDEQLTRKEIEALVNEDRAEPMHKDTVQDSLKKLADWNQVAHDGQKRDRRWWRMPQR